MKKLLILSFGIALLSIFACHKEKNIQKAECFDTTIEYFKNNGGLSIMKGKIKGNTAYYLDRGSTSFDGVDYFINERCDTVCYACGECLPNPDCDNFFADKNTVTIWKK